MYYILRMLSVRLSKEMEARLDRVARRTGRPKSHFVRQAVEEKIEELEDLAIAIERLDTPAGSVSLEDLARELNVGLER